MTIDAEYEDVEIEYANMGPVISKRIKYLVVDGVKINYSWSAVEGICVVIQNQIESLYEYNGFLTEA